MELSPATLPVGVLPPIPGLPWRRVAVCVVVLISTRKLATPATPALLQTEGQDFVQAVAVGVLLLLIGQTPLKLA
jgi:hypothetical protein